MDEIRFLNADTGSDFAYNDAGGVGFFAIHANNDTFEDLEAELLTFFDFLSDFDGVVILFFPYILVERQFLLNVYK